MNVLVTYIDFFPDNHQGGSGKSFEFKDLVIIPDDTQALMVWEIIHRKVRELSERRRPYNVQYEKPPIIVKAVII